MLYTTRTAFGPNRVEPIFETHSCGLFGATYEVTPSEATPSQLREMIVELLPRVSPSLSEGQVESVAGALVAHATREQVERCIVDWAEHVAGKQARDRAAAAYATEQFDRPADEL